MKSKKKTTNKSEILNQDDREILQQELHNYLEDYFQPPFPEAPDFKLYLPEPSLKALTESRNSQKLCHFFLIRLFYLNQVLGEFRIKEVMFLSHSVCKLVARCLARRLGLGPTTFLTNLLVNLWFFGDARAQRVSKHMLAHWSHFFLKKFLEFLIGSQFSSESLDVLVPLLKREFVHFCDMYLQCAAFFQVEVGDRDFHFRNQAFDFNSFESIKNYYVAFDKSRKLDVSRWTQEDNNYVFLGFKQSLRPKKFEWPDYQGNLGPASRGTHSVKTKEKDSTFLQEFVASQYETILGLMDEETLLWGLSCIQQLYFRKYALIASTKVQKNLSVARQISKYSISRPSNVHRYSLQNAKPDPDEEAQGPGPRGQTKEGRPGLKITDIDWGRADLNSRHPVHAVSEGNLEGAGPALLAAGRVRDPDHPGELGGPLGANENRGGEHQGEAEEKALTKLLNNGGRVLRAWASRDSSSSSGR